MSLIRKTLSAALFLLAGASQAAVITWDTPLDYSAPSDVRNDGVVVEAYNLTGIVGAASPTINGVTFVANSTLFTDDATTDFLDGDTGDAAYNQLLNSLDYGSTTSFQFGGGNLESGKDYIVQAWYVDERSSSDARAMQFGDGNGNLSGEVNDQYVVGSFTANGSNQTITIAGTSSSPHFTAYQIRDLSSSIPTLSTSVGETVSASFSIDVDFSETVTGLVANDFTVVNCSVSNVSGSGASWSATVNPTGNGDVQVTLPEDSVLDGDLHGNVASNTILTTYVAPGSEQPVPTLSTTATDVTGDYTVDINFSESVTGLQLSDFVVSSGTVSNLTGSGSSYSLTVSPNFGGDVTISLPKNFVTDTDGDVLQNVVSNELTNAYFITVTVNTPEELLPYLDQDNITATLTPGTYTIDADDVRNTYGTPRFEFWGSNSTYDFTGVTINFAADIYDDGLSMSHMQIFGNNNVLKNLTMVDLCDKYGTAGKSGGVNLVMDGEYNRVEGFYFEIRGSYPYGYGDCFGKGGNYTIKHWKHSGLLVRGNYNHVLNCTLMQESYGHCIFMQAAYNPTIEGCYVEAETVTTDDILAETSGPAFDIDFMTVWGFTLPPGYTKSTSEAGIRAYNAGNTYINGEWISRGTNDPTILDNTLVNTRVGVTLTHAKGFKYVEGCTAIGTERGYAIGSGIIKNCFSDVEHGPAFGVDYGSDSGVIADITILPHEGTNYNGSKHIAYIQGSNHNLTFRSAVQNPEQDLVITVGGDFNHISSSQSVEDNPANDMVINNLTGYPMVVDDNAAGITGQSIGTVTDAGISNSISTQNWDVLDNLAFYGTATQSSDAYDTLASFAIDQNTSGDFADGSVTHTSNLVQPWWQIDLEGTFDISEIKIWNRTGNSPARLSDYDVTLLDANEQVVWTNYQANYPDPSVSLFPGLAGRYVLIQLRGTNSLSLAEVEIFGTELVGPSGLTAVSDPSQIVLNWDAVDNAAEYTVKRATAAGGAYASIGNTASTTFNDSTVVNGTYYFYIVTATVDGVETDPSNEASASFGIAKIPVNFGNITASGYQDGSTHVPANTNDGNLGTRWSASGAGEWIRYDLGALRNVNFLKIAWLNGASRVSTFEIEVSDDDATWTSVTGGQIQSSGTTAELETYDVTDTLARYVRIVGYGNSSNAWNSILEVEIWGSTPVAPSVPVDLAATAGDSEVALSWTLSAGTTEYHVKRSTTDGSGYSTIASLAAGSYVDTSAVNDTTYYYVVSSDNGSSESADSSQVSATPIAPPNVPEDVAAISGDGEVSLSWTVSTGATQHHVKRSTIDGSGYSTITSVAGGAYVDTSVTNGTYYYYVVSAENVSGESADSAQVSAKPFAPIADDELVMPMGTRSGDDMEFSMDSVPGRLYQLQSRESLVLGDWADVGDPVVGTGGSILLEDPDAFLVPTCFYRVQIQP